MQTTQKFIPIHATPYMAISFLSICGLACAQNETVTGNPPETPEAVRGSQQTPTPVEAGAKAEAQEQAPATTLSLGGDFYLGRSDLEGFKRLRDGFWAAGAGPAYPSVFQLNLAMHNRSEAKVAFGVGNLYRDDASTLHQPHEAWYRAPVGGANLTVGKYYVPFALQEWQYETKWGVMLEGERGATTLSASANYNQNTNSPNAYLRVGRNFGEKLNVGVSLGAGKGLSYDSIYNKALSLDATASRNGWTLYSEYMAMRHESSERFNFGWLKLGYDRLGKFKPFIAHWRWHDTTGTFGNFHSTGVGASYNILPQLALEGGFAQTPTQNVKWIQLHWTPDWKVWTKGRPAFGPTAGDADGARIPQQLLPQSKP